MNIQNIYVGFGEGWGGVEEIYRQKIESLEELKKSELQKAFAGEI